MCTWGTPHMLFSKYLGMLWRLEATAGPNFLWQKVRDLQAAALVQLFCDSPRQDQGESPADATKRREGMYTHIIYIYIHMYYYLYIYIHINIHILYFNILQYIYIN